MNISSSLDLSNVGLSVVVKRYSAKRHRYRDRRRGNSQIAIDPQSTSPLSSSLEQLFFHTAILLSQSAQSRNPILCPHLILFPAVTQSLRKFSMHLHLSRTPIFHREVIINMQPTSLRTCWLLRSTRITTESPHRSRSRSGTIPGSLSLNFSLTLHSSASQPRFFCTRSVSIKG